MATMDYDLLKSRQYCGKHQQEGEEHHRSCADVADILFFSM